MKNKASHALKQIISTLISIAKAKSMALKSKTSAAKSRLVMFSLLKNKKVILDSLSHKIHRLLGGQHDKESQSEADDDESKAIVLYNAMANESTLTQLVEVDDEDDKYPDLRHSLFDEEEFEFEDQGGSIVDLVRNSKEEGENFSLEDEIDQVADLFIMRFHKQMRLQKLQSFKRYQEMMERSL
ncbi:uncharacterized protein LOC132179558 [Corylus avellana]|uniref:uncharacterized protein LOC132179558 n=1 Tax=Corylus avellana TaxID=13451 RepID=UPI001E20BBD5|nr:uncharacterized protein LOC132179558 [Corylus avellana]